MRISPFRTNKIKMDKTNDEPKSLFISEGIEKTSLASSLSEFER